MSWGFVCRACGFRQIGVIDRDTAEEHAEMHLAGCAASQSDASYASVTETATSAQCCFLCGRQRPLREGQGGLLVCVEDCTPQGDDPTHAEGCLCRTCDR
jgi:hypothetical protein